MRRSFQLTLCLCFSVLLLAGNLFGQAGNGAVGGTVQDASKGLVPGVTITLTNTGTSVATTQVTNESGVYNFAAVPAGTYSISAALPGFKTSVQNGIVVTQAPIRVNLQLEVGTTESKVEVVATTDSVLTEAGASVGTVLSQQRVSDLPIVGQNILSLLDVLPGFRASPVGDAQSTIGGLNLDYTNTTINGLSTVSSRDSASFWGRQVMTTNVINPDLVGEIRLILSPVDAELGRGNSQIQIQTRSGTNKYTGAVSWNVQNTALNANTWANKRNPGAPTAPNWYNLNQITGSYSGPIQKNKTFFFVLYDKQMVNRRNLVTTPVLTDTARQGIWRYWDGWNPGPALLAEPSSFVSGTTQPTGTAASVNFDGTPLAPKFNPNGTAYSLGGMKCFAVFGNKKFDGSAFTAADCPGGTAVTNATAWDTLRAGPDSTGYIAKILAKMPKANFWAAFGGQTPDGLNTGLYRYVQGRTGSSATNASIGVVQSTDDYNNRDQINLKIDHNLSERHRFNVSWTYEKDSGEASLAAWDGVLNGNQSRRPQFLTVNATSTLTPTLLNEARFGVNYSSEFASPAWANIDHKDIVAEAQKYILYGGKNTTNNKLYPILYNPGNFGLGVTGGLVNVFNGYMNYGSFDFANYSPLFNYADTVRWTHGKHSFSGGGEYRRPSTVGYNNSAYIAVNPTNGGGAATPLFFTGTDLTKGPFGATNFLGTARTNAGNLLSTMYGAINAPSTGFWIDGQEDLKAGKWQDVTTVANRIKSNDPYGHQTRTQIQNEWSFFFKDDYKLTSRLTLNLGVRYDFTGSPYLDYGLTNTLVGEGYGLFGAGRPASGDPFSNWLTAGNLYLSGYGSSAGANALKCSTGTANPNGLPTSNCDPNLMSTVEFVGPKTDHPNKTLIPQKGAFSPAIGFSWQVPWFGDGQTTVRGGFQRTYGKPGSPYTGGLLSGPGSDGTTNGVNTADAKFAPIFASRALNLTDLALVVPATPSRLPSDRIYPVGARSGVLGSYALFDPNFTNPHTDNWTLTVTRSLNRNMTLEVRAINTLARDQSGAGGVFGTPGTYDLNTPNVYHNPELFAALETTRAGGNSVLFDQMLMGMNLNPTVTGYGAIGTTPTGGTLQRGSAHIRRAFATNLANGNYNALIGQILGTTPSVGNGTGNNGAQALPIDPVTNASIVTSQRLLRNGCDRLANNVNSTFVNPDTGLTVGAKCFPENYFIANPQWSSAIYASNLGFSNYNSVEVQFTMRPIHGLSFQTTYGLSKTMVQPGNGFTDPLLPTKDYGKSLQSVGSDLRTNGSFELPIGPNKLLLGNSSGWMARALERWQMGFIYNISAGAPRSFLTNNNMLYANGRPNIVGPWDNPKGKITWKGQNGTFFGDDSYITYADPQCAAVTTADALQTACTLRGLAKVTSMLTPGAILINSATNTYGIPLLENPKPGTQGNLGSATMNTFPRWRLDANLQKTFQISESKSAQLRFDATNIFNHPTPGDPTGLTNQGSSFNDNFGQMTSKTGSRTFQGRLRLQF
jgi:hypothetical protein